jgi:hypothetical protein
MNFRNVSHAEGDLSPQAERIPIPPEIRWGFIYPKIGREHYYRRRQAHLAGFQSSLRFFEIYDPSPVFMKRFVALLQIFDSEYLEWTGRLRAGVWESGKSNHLDNTYTCLYLRWKLHLLFKGIRPSWTRLYDLLNFYQQCVGCGGFKCASIFSVEDYASKAYLCQTCRTLSRSSPT